MTTHLSAFTHPAMLSDGDNLGDVDAGVRFDRAVAEVLDLLDERDLAVLVFEFNDTPVAVHRGETAAQVLSRWTAARERSSPTPRT